MGLLGICRKSSGGKTAALLGGIGIGAALMYALDPQGGRRRRAMARDKAASLAGKTGNAVARTSRDLSNRARGVAAELRSKLGREADGLETAGVSAAPSSEAGGNSSENAGGNGGNGGSGGETVSGGTENAVSGSPTGARKRSRRPDGIPDEL